jgi:hypothetical protein
MLRPEIALANFGVRTFGLADDGSALFAEEHLATATQTLVRWTPFGSNTLEGPTSTLEILGGYSVGGSYIDAEFAAGVPTYRLVLRNGSKLALPISSQLRIGRLSGGNRVMYVDPGAFGITPRLDVWPPGAAAFVGPALTVAPRSDQMVGNVFGDWAVIVRGRASGSPSAGSANDANIVAIKTNGAMQTAPLRVPDALAAGMSLSEFTFDGQVLINPAPGSGANSMVWHIPSNTIRTLGANAADWANHPVASLATAPRWGISGAIAQLGWALDTDRPQTDDRCHVTDGTRYRDAFAAVRLSSPIAWKSCMVHGIASNGEVLVATSTRASSDPIANPSTERVGLFVLTPR